MRNRHSISNVSWVAGLMRGCGRASGKLVLALGLLLLASSAQAQTATPTSRLAWDQTAATLAEASSLAYEATFDGAPIAALSGVTCAGAASPFVCSAPLPALAAGAHAVAVQARNAVGPSPLSAAFNFTFISSPPAAPSNLRIVPGGE